MTGHEEGLALDISARRIVEFHERCLQSHDWLAQSETFFQHGLWQSLEYNHWCNCVLWDQEDQARRADVQPSAILANKRAIDRYNQARNDAIERIDELLLEQIPVVDLQRDAWLNSETIGSMIDRLSILSLKIHHHRLHAWRADIEPCEVDECEQKLLRLREQRQDLRHCVDELLRACVEGKAFFKVYRQFKMYNDPRLNPYLAGDKPRD